MQPADEARTPSRLSPPAWRRAVSPACRWSCILLLDGRELHQLAGDDTGWCRAGRAGSGFLELRGQQRSRNWSKLSAYVLPDRPRRSGSVRARNGPSAVFVRDAGCHGPPLSLRSEGRRHERRPARMRRGARASISGWGCYRAVAGRACCARPRRARRDGPSPKGLAAAGVLAGTGSTACLVARLLAQRHPCHRAFRSSSAPACSKARLERLFGVSRWKQHQRLGTLCLHLELPP